MASWLSTMTSSGRLYEIDLRLRPDGDAGLLAVSIDAFSQYQTQHAWAWEHQAITRARLATGDSTKIGRASCRERVCQYVQISGVAVLLKNKHHLCNTSQH